VFASHWIESVAPCRHSRTKTVFSSVPNPLAETATVPVAPSPVFGVAVPVTAADAGRGNTHSSNAPSISATPNT
jgi:hypothetical protein